MWRTVPAPKCVSARASPGWWPRRASHSHLGLMQAYSALAMHKRPPLGRFRLDCIPFRAWRPGESARYSLVRGELAAVLCLESESRIAFTKDKASIELWGTTWRSPFSMQLHRRTADAQEGRVGSPLRIGPAGSTSRGQPACLGQSIAAAPAVRDCGIRRRRVHHGRRRCLIRVCRRRFSASSPWSTLQARRFTNRELRLDSRSTCPIRTTSRPSAAAPAAARAEMSASDSCLAQGSVALGSTATSPRCGS
jgi:hypothetical protein